MPLRQIIEFLAPSRCLGCGQEGADICLACLQIASSTAGRPRCYSCLRTMIGGVTCATCMKAGGPLAVAVGANYQGVAKELVHALKFGRSRSSAASAAWLIGERLQPARLKSRLQFITAVPISPARMRERGYNQGELIAKELSRNLGIPYLNLLSRMGTLHQIGQGREERLKAIQGAFSFSHRLAGENILLIDDVVTTGATLTEATRALHLAGAGRVYAAVVARSLGT